MTIWKFSIGPGCTLTMPKGATYLSVGVQFNQPCLWALVDPNAEKVTRKPIIEGTGWPDVNPFPRFIGTYMEAGGGLVFHVFEDREES